MSQARRTQKQEKNFYLLRGKDNTQVEYKQATNHSLSCNSTACKLNLGGKISTVLKAPTVLGSTLHRSSCARASNNTRIRWLLPEKNKRCIWTSLWHSSKKFLTHSLFLFANLILWLITQLYFQNMSGQSWLPETISSYISSWLQYTNLILCKLLKRVRNQSHLYLTL